MNLQIKIDNGLFLLFVKFGRFGYSLQRWKNPNV
jgi:hypothetical protein